MAKQSITAKNLTDLRRIQACGGACYLSERWARNLEAKGLVNTGDMHQVSPGDIMRGRSARYQLRCEVTATGIAALSA